MFLMANNSKKRKSSAFGNYKTKKESVLGVFTV